jgi:hypothetical protein
MEASFIKTHRRAGRALDALVALLATLSDPHGTLVWSQGFQTWTRAGDVPAFKEIRDTVDGRPVGSDEMPTGGDGDCARAVLVNVLQVLGELPIEYLRRLHAAAIEAEAKQAALDLPEARRVPLIRDDLLPAGFVPPL